jgi:hypothetical protein
MLFPILLGSAGLGVAEINSDPISCAFKGMDVADPELRINVEPVADPFSSTPGLYKIRLALQGEDIRGSAVPFLKSDARDVVMRAVTANKTTYIIALRDDGTAIMKSKGAKADAVVETRNGICENFEAHLNQWLAS